MSTTSNFHEGELDIQERAGAAVQGRNSGRMIAEAIIPGAVKFLNKQPLLVAGSVDADSSVWASIVVGRPGFMVAQPQSIDVDLSETLRIPHDPLWENLPRQHRIGLLAIDLRTRARLRVNGRVEFPIPDVLRVIVEQAFPNCPQYIQRRNFRPSISGQRRTSRQPTGGTELDSDQHQWVSGADTLFVASHHPEQGVDASHRGGHPGFVRVLSPTRIRIPDYAGNGMFNTLGNFEVNPRAGLIFADFENGRTLQLTGRAQILWDIDDPEGETGGTDRYWDFEIQRVIQTDEALPGTTKFLDYSPHNPGKP